MNRVLLALLLGALPIACAGPSGAPAARTAAATSRLPSVGPLGTPAAAWLAASVVEDDDEADAPGPVGIGWGILMYIPNRVLDVLDIVRARVRFGPGIAFGARATEYADVFVGTYASVYVGLPGPRGRTLPRLPVGLESKTGAEVSVADVTLEGGLSPDYGMTECGVGFQAFLIGVDVGVDPFEILDLVVGLVTFDPMDDDF